MPRAFVIESDDECSHTDDDVEMPPVTPPRRVAFPDEHIHPGYVPLRLLLIMQKLEMVLQLHTRHVHTVVHVHLCVHN